VAASGANPSACRSLPPVLASFFSEPPPVLPRAVPKISLRLFYFSLLGVLFSLSLFPHPHSLFSSLLPALPPSLYRRNPLSRVATVPLAAEFYRWLPSLGRALRSGDPYSPTLSEVSLLLVQHDPRQPHEETDCDSFFPLSCFFRFSLPPPFLNLCLKTTRTDLCRSSQVSRPFPGDFPLSLSTCLPFFPHASTGRGPSPVFCCSV